MKKSTKAVNHHQQPQDPDVNKPHQNKIPVGSLGATCQVDLVLWVPSYGSGVPQGPYL